MTTLIGIFAATTVLWLCYLALVRPLVLDSVEYELSRMRAQLDWDMIDDTAGSRSESAKLLEKTLRSYPGIRWISISQAICYMRSNPAEIKALTAKEREVYRDAPAWVRDMQRRQRELSMKAALANSPSWWIPLAAILLCSFFSKKVEEFWTETETATNGLKCPA